MNVNQRDPRDTRPDADPVCHGLRDERFHGRQPNGRPCLGSHAPSTVCCLLAPRRHSPTEANLQIGPTQGVPVSHGGRPAPNGPGT